MHDYLTTLGLGLLAGVKYLLAAGITFGYKYTGYQGFLIVTVGGILGVFVFTILSEKINLWIKKKFKKKKKISFLRFLVKLRISYGLLGISILTPILLSIPVGCYLAKTFARSNKKIITYMSLSILLWGVIIFGVKVLFNINITEKL